MNHSTLLTRAITCNKFIFYFRVFKALMVAWVSDKNLTDERATVIPL